MYMYIWDKGKERTRQSLSNYGEDVKLFLTTRRLVSSSSSDDLNPQPIEAPLSEEVTWLIEGQHILTLLLLSPSGRIVGKPGNECK